MTKNRILPLAALALISTSALSGCALIDAAQNEHGDDFGTTASLAENWDKTAEWIPGDATDIRTWSAITGDTAILRATTDETLDPALCVTVDRQSGPVYDRDWSVDPYAVSEAWACGDWTVIPTDDGWYGWTPSHPDEKLQSPTS